MESSVLVNHVYSIKLCSGEIRLWKHLGEGSGGEYGGAIALRLQCFTRILSFMLGK